VKRAALLLSAMAVFFGAVSPRAVADVAPPPEATPAPAEDVPASTETTARAPETPRHSIRETGAALPKDLIVSISADAHTTSLKVTRAGELVLLRRGRERVGGGSTATLAIPRGAEADASIVIETTHARTLATTRALVHLDASSKVTAHLAEPPETKPADERLLHACRSHDDGFGGLSVLCRVDAEVNAASVTGEDPREGVVAMVGRTSLVRFDFDAARGSADSKMIAYNARGKGVVVRAEASFLEGEAAPSLAVLSAERAQPVVVRRFVCRMPMVDF
jgi:hypothetical protein